MWVTCFYRYFTSVCRYALAALRVWGLAGPAAGGVLPLLRPSVCARGGLRLASPWENRCASNGRAVIWIVELCPFVPTQLRSLSSPIVNPPDHFLNHSHKCHTQPCTPTYTYIIYTHTRQRQTHCQTRALFHAHPHAHIHAHMHTHTHPHAQLTERPCIRRARRTESV